jgi:DNA-binding HxlR family transcriptional regulator
VPSRPWTGYRRFCPLARGLDVIGDRWTLVIVNELVKRPWRYGELHNRLPGIGTNLLADRLRRLEAAGVIARQPRSVGEGVEYALTERGRGLEEPLEALRRWGVPFLFDPTADGEREHEFDVSYVEGIDALTDGEFELVVDGRATRLSFAGGYLRQFPGHAAQPELVVSTSAAFFDRWAAGEIDWDEGVAAAEVNVEGPEASWPRWLAATGYLLRFEPEPTTTD